MLSRTAEAASGVPTRVSISSSSAGSDTGRASMATDWLTTGSPEATRGAATCAEAGRESVRAQAARQPRSQRRVHQKTYLTRTSSA